MLFVSGAASTRLNVDALGHRLTEPGDGEGGGEEYADPNEDIFEEVCARDSFSELSQHLGETERETLALLREGMGLREIAEGLCISRPTAIKRRRRIGQVARRLGMRPCSPSV